MAGRECLNTIMRDTLCQVVPSPMLLGKHKHMKQEEIQNNPGITSTKAKYLVT